MEKTFSFKRAATIKVPDEFFKPLSTKIKEVDDIFSELGGVIPSQVVMISGNPGAGKTTLCLAIAACLSSQTEVAFISLEMSDFQLANQSKKIPGFGRIMITDDFDPQETMNQIRKMKPGLIILDSIQKAARKMKDQEGKSLPFDRAQYMIVEMFTKYAKETWTPVFLIGHCDKSGNYKGPSDLLHDVDSHLMVSYDKEMDLRTFGFGKNRFGGLMDDSLFGITRDQVWIGSPYISNVFGDAVIEPSVPNTAAPVKPSDLDTKLKISLDELKKSWNGSNAKNLIELVVEKLKCDDPEFEERTFIKHRSKLKLRFSGKGVAHCHPKSGELVFGKKTFTTMVIGKVGYAKEQKYIISRCTTQADLLVWVICHEFCHLYDGLQHHKNEFFEEVAKKYDWLLSNI